MSRIIYGYARISTADQNLDRQIEQLKEHINDERYILRDVASGKDFNRKAYKSLVGTDETAPRLQAGDLLIIVSLDRLGRDYIEIRQEWDHIVNNLKADIKVLDMPLLDTSISTKDLDRRFIADLVLQILSYTAEKERENIRKRQRQGIDVMPVVNGKKVSSRTGKPTGRPRINYPAEWKSIYEKWERGEITAIIAMNHLMIKRTTFYKLIKQYGSV